MELTSSSGEMVVVVDVEAVDSSSWLVEMESARVHGNPCGGCWWWCALRTRARSCRDAFIQERAKFVVAKKKKESHCTHPKTPSN